MHVLVVNCGSSSLKMDVLASDTGAVLARGTVERIGAVTALARWGRGDTPKERESLDAPDHARALEFLLGRLVGDTGGDGAPLAVEAVGHRVVHGGEHFTESVLVDAEVVEAIRDAFDLAPLHNPANLRGIEAARKAFPDLPHAAVFDTAFHQTLPPEAFLYAIPHRLYRRHRLRRYGFHGPSHQYVSRRLFEIAGLDAAGSRVVTAHLGNGCSLAAIAGGRSVDTSMGLTPTGGVVMGTRSGDLDPGLLFEIVEKEEMSLSELHALLNRYSGLLGLSGYAADMRDLLAEADRGDERCRQAVAVFCYRIRSTIGQYLAVLGGCDALVFTAGIGANSPRIRAMICDGLDGLGFVLDDAANESAVNTEVRISAESSPVQVWAIPTNEELVIARDTARLAEAARHSPYV